MRSNAQAVCRCFSRPSFPSSGLGTHCVEAPASMGNREAGASRNIGSQAGAWEPDKDKTLAMGCICRFLFCYLSFFLFPFSLSAATLELKQGNATAILQARKVEKGRVETRLSDEMSLNLSVVASAKPEVAPVTFSSPIWQIREEKATTTPLEDGCFRWRQTFIVEPKMPDKQELHLPELTYREPGKEWQKVKWQPIPVLVTTDIKKPDVSQLRDISTIEELPPKLPSFLLLAVAGGGALLVLGLLAVIFAAVLLQRRGPKSESIPPEQRALRSLEQLRSALPATQEEVEPFHTRLAEVIRVYLEQKYQIPACRRTSHEFVEALAANDRLPAEQMTLLQGFFERCDLGKFAPLHFSQEECTQTIDLAQTFIEQIAGLSVKKNRTDT